MLRAGTLPCCGLGLDSARRGVARQQEPAMADLRAMEPRDVASAHRLLANYLAQYVVPAICVRLSVRAQ